jgi:outer membrane protein assembly factor BamE (lipoprotein component of BamABCDE complex)
MFGIAKLLSKTLRAAVLGIAVLSLSACATTYRNHGYVPTDEDLEEIVVGVDTRDSVAETIGTPSSSGMLNDSGYYYVATRVRYFGASKPKVITRELVAISFNASGVVQNIERFGLQDGQVVPLQRRVTSSGANDVAFLRQLLGNLGNFNPGSILQQ